MRCCVSWSYCQVIITPQKAKIEVNSRKVFRSFFIFRTADKITWSLFSYFPRWTCHCVQGPVLNMCANNYLGNDSLFCLSRSSTEWCDFRPFCPSRIDSGCKGCNGQMVQNAVAGFIFCAGHAWPWTELCAIYLRNPGSKNTRDIMQKQKSRMRKTLREHAFGKAWKIYSP